MIKWSMIYKILLNWQLRVTLWTTEVTKFKNWMGIPGILLFNNRQRFHFCQFDVNSSNQILYFSVFCCFYGIHSNQTLWTFCYNFHSSSISWHQIISFLIINSAIMEYFSWRLYCVTFWCSRFNFDIRQIKFHPVCFTSNNCTQIFQR